MKNWFFFLSVIVCCSLSFSASHTSVNPTSVNSDAYTFIAPDSLAIERQNDKLLVGLPSSFNSGQVFILSEHGETYGVMEFTSNLKLEISIAGYAEGNYLLLIKTSEGEEAEHFFKIENE